ncbi:ATP-binding protein, partial [Thermoproteota archaeon]
YITIEDEDKNSKLVVQVYDEHYLDHQGLVEDMVRDEVMRYSADFIESDPLKINTISYFIRDIRLLKCKIRGSINNNKFTSSVSWLPSRVKSKLQKIRVTKMLKLAGQDGLRKIKLGESHNGEPLNIFAEDLDGQLNIITGKKGSGKSHLSKLLASELVKHGGYVFIFDINNEYGGLALNKDRSPSMIAQKCINLTPGDSLVFNLKYLGLSSLVGLLSHVLDIPGASLREFIRMWKDLESQNSVSMSSLKNIIQTSRCNEFVRDAVYSRFHTLLSSKLFSDEKSFKIEDIFSKLKDGGLIIISLGQISPLIRQMVVEIFLSKLVDLLEKKDIPPIFLFAEEAHLYLRETYWGDIITRMRHFGIFTTFITNEPNAINDGIFRQVDNVFLFNFTNDTDLEKIGRVTMIDTETVKSMVRTLPPRTCLTLGRVVANLPVKVEVAKMDVLTLGETKLFFKPIKEVYPILNT